jgi:hypothetical protein
MANVTATAPPFVTRPTLRGPLQARVAAIAALMIVIATSAGRVFDRFEWSLPIVVAGVAVVAALVSGWSAALRNLVLVVASFVASSVAIVAASGDAFSVRSVFNGPRRLLTTEWPSPYDAAAVGTVALVLSLLTAVACVLASEERWHLAPLVPALIALVGVLALSAPSPPGWLMLGAVGFGAFVYSAVSVTTVAAARAARGRTTYPRKKPRRSLRAHLARLVPWHGGRTLLAAAVGLAVVGIVTGSWLGYRDRADPRQVAPAAETASLLQSLESVVAVREAEPPFSLFSVVDESNALAEPLPARWRLGAFDTYDGQRWLPTVAVRPIGGRLGDIDATSSPRPPVQYSITVMSGTGMSGTGSDASATATTDTDGVLPFPGNPISINTDVLTDLSRVVVRTADPLVPGTTFRAVAERPPTAGEARDATVATRPVDDISAAFTETARELGGDGTALEQLQRMATTMSGDWRLDSSSAAGGQPTALLQRFTDETNRGTAEQFVGAFVLMARSLGYDARVAIGFEVPVDDLESPLNLRSNHTSVWPEVNFVDVGWVPFNPVPATITADSSEPQIPPEAQAPAAAQPPIAPPADRSAADEDVDDTDSAVAGGWAGWRKWAVRIGAVAGLALLPVALAVGTILSVKALRRRRRRRAPTASECVRGVWANTTDALVDAGLTIQTNWTNDHIAVHGADVAPAAQHEMRRLAALATSATFGPPADHTSAANAARTELVVADAIAARLTRWQRWRWRLSLRSLRPSTRSPVVV